MSEKIDTFPGRTEWVLAGICLAAITLGPVENHSSAQAEAISTPAPIIGRPHELYPTMVPAYQLPTAVRRPELDKKPYSKESK